MLHSPSLPFTPSPLATRGGGDSKTSIQYALLLFTPLYPLHSSLPSHPLPPGVVRTLKPSIQYAVLPFAPLCSPLPPSLLLALPPLAPTEVAGTIKPSITYPHFPLLPSALALPHPITPCPHRGGRDPKT